MLNQSAKRRRQGSCHKVTGVLSLSTSTLMPVGMSVELPHLPVRC
jgi:hypothetical protein